MTHFWYTIQFIALQYPTFLQPWFDEYPNVMCTVFQADITMGSVIMSTLQPIISLTVFLKFNPLKFQELNHERLYQRLFIIWALFNGTLLFIPLFFYGTLCSKSRVNRFIRHEGINISLDKIRTSYCSEFNLFLNIFLLVFPLIIKNIIICLPTKDEHLPSHALVELPKIPTVTAYNQKVLLRGSYFEPLVSKYGIWKIDVVAENKFLRKSKNRKFQRSKTAPTIDNIYAKSNFTRSESIPNLQFNRNLLENTNGGSKFYYHSNRLTDEAIISKNKYNLEDFQEITKPKHYSYEDVPIAHMSKSTTIETYKGKTDMYSIEIEKSDDSRIALPSTSTTSNSSDFNQKKLMKDNELKGKEVYDLNNSIKRRIIYTQQKPVIQVREYKQTKILPLNDAQGKIPEIKKKRPNLRQVDNLSPTNKNSASSNFSKISPPINIAPQLASSNESLDTVSQVSSTPSFQKINESLAERLQPYKTVLLMILVGLLVIVNKLVPSGNAWIVYMQAPHFTQLSTILKYN